MITTINRPSKLSKLSKLLIINYILIFFFICGCVKHEYTSETGPTVEGRVVSKFYEAPYDTTDYITLTSTDSNGNTHTTVIPIVTHNPAVYNISFNISSRGPYYGKTYTFDDKNLYNLFSTNDRCFIETLVKKDYIVDKDDSGKITKKLIESELKINHISRFGPLESN